MPQSTSGDFYCSQKFTWLSVDLEKRQTFSCCAARPAQVDINWIKQNPGQLFNTPVLQNEREQMLLNQPVASCEEVCWKPEQANVISRRQMLKSQTRTHVDIDVVTPEELNIVLGSTCNLTCSYCCKEYSSRWRQDIIENGDYQLLEIDDRYSLTSEDKVISKVSQNNRYNSKHSQILYKEMELLSPHTKQLIITGGEPFLNNNLLDIIEKAKLIPDIKIFTGLGVSYKRFERILDKLKDYKNVRLDISAENLDEFLEFNRYGITSDDFLRKIQLLDQTNIKYLFHSVLCNLSLFGFVDFYNKFNSKIEEIDLVYQPDFMSIHVMDSGSKERIKQQLNNTDYLEKDKIIQSLDAVPTTSQIKNLKNFLIEFVKRRKDLDINIFPKTFLEWMNNVV
jgi:organic radical activating enzyme